MKELCTLSYRL